MSGVSVAPPPIRKRFVNRQRGEFRVFSLSSRNPPNSHQPCHSEEFATKAPEGQNSLAMDFRFFAPLRMTFAENEKALGVNYISTLGRDRKTPVGFTRPGMHSLEHSPTIQAPDILARQSTPSLDFTHFQVA